LKVFANKSKLIKKVQLGEDSYLELKEVRFVRGKIRSPRQSELADEFAAFANGRGGTLLLGVADKTRKILGIPLAQLDDVETLICQACEDSVNPSLVQCHSLNKICHFY